MMDSIRDFEQLRLQAAESLKTTGPVKVALSPADDPESLYALNIAAELSLADPVLVGDPTRINKIAVQSKVDISAFRLVSSAAREDALRQAVTLVQSGEVDLLARGNLKADEFLKILDQESTGLRREGQFWSHVGIFWPQTLGRFLLVSDAFVNADPSVEDMPRLMDNAIEVARSLGLEKPRVALLTGVETVDPRQPIIEGAAAIARMAAQGRMYEAIVDGPMPYDAAVDEEAARRQNYVGEVAGRADILIVNNLEVGHLLYKAILMHGPVQSAGLLLGAGKPVIFCSRNEVPGARVNAIALAIVMMRG